MILFGLFRWFLFDLLLFVLIMLFRDCACLCCWFRVVLCCWLIERLFGSCDCHLGLVVWFCCLFLILVVCYWFVLGLLVVCLVLLFGALACCFLVILD